MSSAQSESSKKHATWRPHKESLTTVEEQGWETRDVTNSEVDVTPKQVPTFEHVSGGSQRSSRARLITTCETRIKKTGLLDKETRTFER